MKVKVKVGMGYNRDTVNSEFIDNDARRKDT